MALSGQRLLVVDDANGKLVSLTNKDLVVEREYAVGARPWHVVATLTHAWVTLRGGDSVARIELATGKIQQFYVGTGPVGLGLSPDASLLFVATEGTKQMLKLDATTGVPWHSVAIGAQVQAVVVPNLDTVVLVHQNAAPDVFPVVPSKAINVDPGLALTKGSILRGEGDLSGNQGVATRAVAAAINPVSGWPVIAHVVASPGRIEDAAFMAPVPVQDCNSKGGVSSLGDGGSKGGLSSQGDGGYGGGSSNTQAPRRPIEPALTEFALKYDSFTATGWRRDTGHPSSLLADDGRALAARIDQPSDIAFHPTRRLALIVGRGGDNVVALDSASGQAIGLAKLPAGSSPRSIVLSEQGDVAYVLLAHEFRVAEIPLATFLDPRVLPTRVAMPQRYSVPYGQDPLPASARLGRSVFFGAENSRLSKGGRFACATCHLDGGADQLVWVVPDGARQTPTLAGRLAGTGPFNWKGTHALLQNNMKDTVQRMGGLGLTQEELVSLEEFLLVGLTAPVNPHLAQSGLTPAQQRGKDIFNSQDAGCATCHPGGSGSDGQLHDVGIATAKEGILQSLSGFGESWLRFNTPSLKGVYASAPYFHNGKAATLEQVLAMTSDHGWMGDTSALTPEQRQDLIAYLLTL